ncbi:unnamed protein product, partial [Effrenium voratum]
GQTTRVLSWNILAPSLCSGAFFKDLHPEVFRWQRRAAQIKALFFSLAPEIVCLQEVEVERSLEELGLTGYATAQVQRPAKSDGSPRKDGCMVAWSPQIFELVRQHHFCYDDFPQPAADGDTSPSGHVALLVELRSRSSCCAPLLVATTHLAWREEREELRRWQASVLVEAIHKFGSADVVICGDLNCVPGSSTHGFLSGFFHSAHQDVEGATDELGRCTATNALAREGRGFAE